MDLAVFFCDMPPSAEQLGLDLGPEVERIMRRFYPLLISRAFGDAEAVVGVTVAFDLDNPFVQDVVRTLAKRVTAIADTTRTEIQDLIGQQAANGWSVDELAAAIRAHGVTASETRSELIAVTETASAYSQGSLLAFQQSGVVGGTEWLVSDPCPICAPLAGTIAPLGGSFADGIDHPPAHPRCRCAIAPVLK